MMNLVQHLFRAALGIAYHPLFWLHQLSENQAARAAECLVTNSVQGKKHPQQTDKKTQPNQRNKTPKEVYICVSTIVLPIVFGSVPNLLLLKKTFGDPQTQVWSREKHCEAKVHHGCIIAPSMRQKAKEKAISKLSFTWNDLRRYCPVYYWPKQEIISL